MKSPDPTVKLTSSKGVIRTLDDWTTLFHLCLVVLPPRPEAARFIPVARRIFSVLGDSDCRTAYCVMGNEFIAKGVLGDAEQEALTLCDPDGELVKSLGLTHLPAIVHLRQDTSLVAGAEGWDPAAWQDVVKGIAEAMSWTHPELGVRGDPPPTAGWAV